jgi:hypothetical protein
MGRANEMKIRMALENPSDKERAMLADKSGRNFAAGVNKIISSSADSSSRWTMQINGRNTLRGFRERNTSVSDYVSIFGEKLSFFTKDLENIPIMNHVCFRYASVARCDRCVFDGV